MSDNDVNPDIGRRVLAENEDFEEVLELLIELAQSEQRDFLAYLLRMALIEARHGEGDQSLLRH
jgi:hypothetical protein